MQLRVDDTHFRFGTKAENLARLSGLLEHASVLPLVHFSIDTWRRKAPEVLNRIRRELAVSRVVVRSSAQAEDGARSSMAGAFRSLLAVDAMCDEALVRAVEQVAASMTGNPADQVLVQPMLDDVGVSGVVMTHDLVHGAPYYIIDYDDETGRTDCITGGVGTHKSLRIYRNTDPAHLVSPRVTRFLALARELEDLCPGVPLDIEFAMTRDGRMYLLQVRRIAAAHRWHPVTERRVARQLVFVEAFVKRCSLPRSGYYGRRTILGVMPDWNPAEMIGTAPRPLATSLYRELITRSVWREARQAIGYRALPPDELMVVINSRPYIDVRASFNSLLPRDIAPDTGERLVDAWLDRLDAHPELHDKVEFEIASTCLDFCFDSELARRYPGLIEGPALEQYRHQLRSVTLRALDQSFDSDIARGERLLNSLTRLPHDLPHVDAPDPLTMAIRNLRRCRQQGTRAFAVIARHAFIAEALLRSAVARCAIDADALQRFRRSIHTVTSSMLEDYNAVASGRLPRAVFIEQFGHLRPGTYDITSARYDQRDDLFAASHAAPVEERRSDFELSMKQAQALDALLTEHGFAGVTSSSLLAFARRAISGREAAKFAFTRVLSDVLELLAEWGTAQGLSRDDLSFLDWSVVEQYAVDPAIDYADRHFLNLAADGRRRHAEAHAFHLSHLIRDSRDIYVALQHRSAPNFIGIRPVSGPVIELMPSTHASVNLYGSVVLIENADPGYDWVFTRGILGLVTKFGGANSHMAIRCAELDIPAAIGCGEQSYRRLLEVGFAELDGGTRVLRAAHAA